MKPIACTYIGLQHIPDLPSFALWTILDPAGIPGHPYESTVTEPTLREAGYVPYEANP